MNECVIEEIKMKHLEENYDIVVFGAGHAGCEAALAGARLGLSTIMFTVSAESIALHAGNMFSILNCRKTRSVLPWPGCFCVMDLNRNMVSGKSRISRKPLLGNHFSVGKICRFLISATAEIS